MTNQIKIEYGQKTSSTQAPTTVPATTIAEKQAAERKECEDADLCQLVFRNDYAGKNCQGK